MARNKSRFPALVFIFVLMFLGVSVSIHSPRGEPRRVKRQACEEYTYEGRTCCKCGAGFKLKEHCSARKDDQKCELCADGTFNPVPSSLKSCELCEPCSQSVHLEVAISCSSTNDTVCKCKDRHYCISGTHPCTSCSPCTVCDPGVGVKAECSLTADTICNEVQGTDNLAAVLSVCFLIAVIAVIVFVICLKKRKAARGNSAHQENGVNPPEIAMKPLIGKTLEDPSLSDNVDLMPHIPDIAPAIGWVEMRNIAMRSNMHGTVESIQQDNPHDSQERTIHLLRAWVEKEGGGASGRLIQCLRSSENNLKADKVTEILHKSNNSPV